MRRIKTALDPHGVLNPGKKIPPAQSSVEHREQRGCVVRLIDAAGELAPVVDRELHRRVVDEAVHVGQRPVAEPERRERVGEARLLLVGRERLRGRTVEGAEIAVLGLVLLDQRGSASSSRSRASVRRNDWISS